MQSYQLMRYGVLIIPSDDVTIELFTKINIPITPIILRGTEENYEVAKRFVASVVEISLRIEKHFKTNIPNQYNQQKTKTIRNMKRV